METYTAITMETNITQGNFPFQKGRSYWVHPGRAANLILGGDAIEGAPEGAEIFDVPEEEGARYPIAAPEQIPDAVVAPEEVPVATDEAPEPEPEVAPEAPAAPEPPPAATAPEAEGIVGADALTPKPRKGKVAGTNVTGAPPPATK